MLLDRIDIDAHGPLKRVEIGPLAEHLNVVFAPDGSGKTAISRFVRDALVDRDYPLGMFSSSTGRVVLGDRHGLVHCHREKDGTPSGRRRVEFEARGDFHGRYDLLDNPWLTGISKSTDQGATFASLEMPEAIVDGVITETSGSSVARVVSACVRSGLDSPASYQALPLHAGTPYADWQANGDAYETQQYEQRRTLRRQLADVEAELARLSNEDADYDSLVARRNRLTQRLAQPLPAGPTVSENQRRQLEQRSENLQHRARGLRSQQSELRRRLADLELDLASCDLGHLQDSRCHQEARNDYQVLCRDRDTVIHELDRVTSALDACLNEAAEVGRTLRSLPNNGRHLPNNGRVSDQYLHEYQLERDAIEAEVRRIDQRLSILSRIQWLRAQRGDLFKQLRVAERPVRTRSPLAESASRWLIRLSDGRLRRVEWSGVQFNRDLKSYHRGQTTATGVLIDGRDETHCPAADRMLASIAVRMAAADFLAQTGRHVPLLLEIPADAMEAIRSSYLQNEASQSFYERGDHLRVNHPLAASLRDYVQSGRQVLVLTSSENLASQLRRVGARAFQIHTQRIVHPHRPLWKSQYQGETYVGPHPHTDASRDGMDDTFAHHVPASERASHADVNRDFDLAWLESQSTSHRRRSSAAPDTSHHTDWARDGIAHRDGYYFADTFTTDHPPVAETQPTLAPQVNLSKRNQVGPASPFYLTVDSPIDQAPSVDAVAAARLRGLKVTHITHLMQRDPNRLSDALGMASVDAATIRRWQAECRLACRVPNLRGFDARILVGCGITTPGQLAAIHPTDLLHEVEAFLATERGQQVLLSGTSQELSRLMTWVATANTASDRRHRGHSDEEHRAERRRRIIRTMQQRESLLHTGHPHWDTEEGQVDAIRRRHDEPLDSETAAAMSESRRRRRSSGQATVRSDVAGASADTDPQRFFLHRDSPVVDAPAIGPKMANRLHAIGIETVDDLLGADPESLASDLDHHRVDAATVMRWQQQAILVCRIPMLRGHDAQLLVAAEVTTPEALAKSDPEQLFAVVDEIASSNRGKRILRGGNSPDLTEVKQWVRWAGRHRSLRAA